MVRTSQEPARRVERGDAMQVVRMSRARRSNKGRGFSLSYVMKCLRKERHSPIVDALHDELVALRTPSKRSKR